MKNDIKLNPEEILKLEFEYAKDSSIKAQEDRLSLVNFYIGLYAGVGTLAFGLRDFVSADLTKFIPLAFIALGLISYIFILILVRLRQAWVESIRAMNKIKEYYIDQDENLKKYIIWKTSTIPKAEKFKTISYMSALLVSILGSAGILVGLALFDAGNILSVAGGIIYFAMSIASYHLMLKYNT